MYAVVRIYVINSYIKRHSAVTHLPMQQEQKKWKNKNEAGFENKHKNQPIIYSLFVSALFIYCWLLSSGMRTGDKKSSN